MAILRIMLVNNEKPLVKNASSWLVIGYYHVHFHDERLVSGFSEKKHHQWRIELKAYKIMEDLPATGDSDVSTVDFPTSARFHHGMAVDAPRTEAWAKG